MRPTRVVLFSEANSKFGAPLLEDLLRHPGVTVAGLVTSPEGRLCDYYVGEPDPVALSATAAADGVLALRPERVNDAAVISALSTLAPDYLIIGNYQQIMKEELLALPRRAVVNFHPSPVPRYAGLAPFFWMARRGERDAGVSAVLTTARIDDGPVLAQREVRLNGHETSGQIRAALFAESRRLWREVIPRLVRGDLRATPQNSGRRTYFSAPTDGDRTIDWRLPAEEALRTVRACSPAPGARIAGLPDTTRVFAADLVAERTAPLGPPGTIVADAGHGLLVACQDAWIRILRIGPGPELDLGATPAAVPA